jgi:hypothetical protein
LDFGYAFSGSIGFVLTLPSDQALFRDGPLDQAIEKLEEVATATTSEQIAFYARSLGAAVIRSAYQWARNHADASMSADIEWMHEDAPTRRLRVQLPRFRELTQVIAETSDEVVEEITVVGMLVGADVGRRSFHLAAEGGEIRGSFVDAISEVHTVELPRPYKAILQKTSLVQFAMEEERVSYVLLSLTPLS